ncbi:GSE1_3 [Sanghuangporus sanghuang]
MKVLWDRVVSKVVLKLNELGIVEGSRIWWCLTSFLSLLPFHAAGPYDGADGSTKYLLDDYISSYTPTLMSLINARSGVHSRSQKLLVVGDTTLPSAMRELGEVRKFRPVNRCLLGERASCAAVIDMLPKVEWVHFSCHGILNREPYKSSFKLSDGKLSLLDIVRARLVNAEFAFLSACHTAEQRPSFAREEALYLAAAMQFCGYRSVVGTMWKLLDRDGPFLAGHVYRYLMEEIGEDEVRFKRAAIAVRNAAQQLRAWIKDTSDMTPKNKMTERWVNLVHIGA